MEDKAKGVGLALSGGGARGLAHIGVLSVLERESIPLAGLSGASMGGVVAAAYAAGLHAGELRHIAEEMSHWHSLARLIDPRPPRKGLIAGKKLREFLGGYIPSDLSFQDLEIPLALQAVDLNSGESVAMTEGSVLQAALATCAFPGVLSPIQHHGRLLVDGGVLNNLPVDLTRRLTDAPVLAVDVSPAPGEGMGDGELDFDSRVPDFAQVPYRTAMIMSAALKRIHLAESQPNLILRPGIPPRTGLFSGFRNPEAIIGAGESAAKEALSEIRRLAGVRSTEVVARAG
jgi:NTE family protein